MDGVGFKEPSGNINFHVTNQQGILPSMGFHQGNAVNSSFTPNLAKLYSSKLFRTLKAHGKAVGLPSDEDMGNSEVGHNALGSGRIFAQGAKLVNEAISSKTLFHGNTWKYIISPAEIQEGKNTLHFCGLFSDGNVHSHEEHLYALIRAAKNDGVKKVRLHLLLDGRDVPPTSALTYISRLESFLQDIVTKEFDCQVASGGGRTFVTMDRYESNWDIVQRGYNAHVLGEGRFFSSLREAVTTYRKELNCFDQDLPAFVIAKNNAPIGKVNDNDSFIFFNFRGDRAIQITRALTEKNFDEFPRRFFPNIRFAGMMQYDGDLKIPKNYLVTPPQISETITELLSEQGVKQFACSETQKYGHVTYFWNGNRSGKFNENLENYVEIPSDQGNYALRPWMKSAEITDITIQEMKKNSFQIGRINFANGDMVGHTGDFFSAQIAMQSVDLALGRLMQAAIETNTVLIVTSDHGNCDEMFELDKKTNKVVFDQYGQPKQKTSHTLSPVPFAIYNSECLPFSIRLRDDLPNAGLANIPSTVLALAGFYPPDVYEPSLLKLDQNKIQVLDDGPSKARLDFTDNPEKRFELAQETLKFADTIAHLRAPDGCPWDKEQTHLSLTPFLIEEAYEVVNAAKDFEVSSETSLKTEKRFEFCEELGDVLLQVFLHAQIASEKKDFSITDIVKAIQDKMVRRHPHVFHKDKEQITDSSQVLEQWEELKEKEKKIKSKTILDKAIGKKSQPTLTYATYISQAATNVGFGWSSLEETFLQLSQEVEELRIEISAAQPDASKIMDEIGDVLFSLSHFMYFIQKRSGEHTINLDLICRASIEKFILRFTTMAQILEERGQALTESYAKSMTYEQWTELWDLSKQRLGTDIPKKA